MRAAELRVGLDTRLALAAFFEGLPRGRPAPRAAAALFRVEGAIVRKDNNEAKYRQREEV